MRFEYEADDFLSWFHGAGRKTNWGEKSFVPTNPNKKSSSPIPPRKGMSHAFLVRNLQFLFWIKGGFGEFYWEINNPSRIIGFASVMTMKSSGHVETGRIKGHSCRKWAHGREILDA